jgi:hypothetical protein
MMSSDNSDSLQPTSLSTLIGYITGPKAEQPVGVRVVEPPSGTRQKQRGNMYGVVDLSGDHPDHDVIADHLLTVMQRTYYSAKGSQSHVMIEAVRRAHQVLHEINLRHPDSALRAGVLCAAMLNGRLVVVASGSAMALVRVNEQVQMFPSELPVEQSASPNADMPVQIFRQTLRRDDVVFLGGSNWLGYVPIKTLAGIVAFTNADNCADAADELYAHGGESSPPGLLIVLIDDPDAQRPGPSAPGSHRQTKGRTARFLGLPTALSAAPPVQPSSAVPAAQLSGKSADPVQPVIEASVPPGPQEEPRANDQAGEPQGESQPRAGPTETTTEESQQGEGWSTKMSAAAAAGVTQTKRFLTRMLPDSSGGEVTTDQADGAPDASHESDESLGHQLVNQDGSDSSVDQEISPSALMEGSPMEKSPPPPFPEIEPFTAPAPASGIRARLFVLLSLVILILVPSVVAAVYWGEGETRRQQAEQLTEAAQERLTSAETSLNLGDKIGAREHLVDAEDYLSQAIAYEGSNEQRNYLAAEIEQMLQDVLQVQLLYGLVSPLVTFPADARPHRMLVADSSIYVLDNGRQVVLRYRYDPSVGEVTDETPQVVLQQGDLLDGATVGSLADMAWLPRITGIEDKPTLLVLDRNNNLFSYDPRVEGARRLELNSQEEWRSASQVQTYSGRIYVADEGTNEIYRYIPGQSNKPPDPWFSDDTLVNLAGTIAMEIDGDIWLLLGSGNIMRYRAGEQLPFSLENSVGLAEEPVDMYVTTEDRQQIYLADAGQDRILVYDKDGVYVKQLKAAEGDPLRGLSAIFIDEITQRLYILTKSALFSHPLL